LSVPTTPKIYHIVHFDRLPSIIEDKYLWCDREIIKRECSGTSIGMNKIKHRRLTELKLTSYPELFVGDCVPFYFCSRSVMLYIISRGNHFELSYQNGQESIIHLQADLYEAIEWARQNSKKWVFTTSNAGSRYFNDSCNIAQLKEIDWDAVNTLDWSGCKEKKQAEFLIEQAFPWHLVNYIGVQSERVLNKVSSILQNSAYKPKIGLEPKWYY